MELIVTKTPGGFAPADRASKEAWQSMKQGAQYKAKITRGRNLKHHRKFYALMTVAIDNLPEENAHRWPTVERLVWELKCQTGRFDIHVTLGGKETVIPHSISFAKMDQDEFSTFYNQCLLIICKHIIPGIDDAALREAAAMEIGSFA